MLQPQQSRLHSVRGRYVCQYTRCGLVCNVHKSMDEKFKAWHCPRTADCLNCTGRMAAFELHAHARMEGPCEHVLVVRFTTFGIRRGCEIYSVKTTDVIASRQIMSLL